MKKKRETEETIELIFGDWDNTKHYEGRYSRKVVKIIQHEDFGSLVKKRYRGSYFGQTFGVQWLRAAYLYGFG